jgi:hypothetical protein
MFRTALTAQCSAPPDDRKALREALGVEDRFVVLIVAGNFGTGHKNWQGQLEAFGRLHARHPDTLLLAHTAWRTPIGRNLRDMAREQDVPADAVRFSDLDRMKAGLVPPEELRDLYGAADLFSNCTLDDQFQGQWS